MLVVIPPSPLTTSCLLACLITFLRLGIRRNLAHTEQQFTLRAYSLEQCTVAMQGNNVRRRHNVIENEGKFHRLGNTNPLEEGVKPH
jgi:hypothetical protein